MTPRKSRADVAAEATLTAAERAQVAEWLRRTPLRCRESGPALRRRIVLAVKAGVDPERIPSSRLAAR